MKLFKNEKLEKVNEQLSKLETKKAGIENKISEMEKVLNQTYELYATQQVSDKDIDEAHAFLKERRQELSDIERMITRVEAVKNKVKIESVPMIREWHNKQVATGQKNVDKAVKEALEAREVYVKALAKVGQETSKMDTPNGEYNALMRELGEREVKGGVNVPHVYPETIIKGNMSWEFKEVDTLGLSKKTQNDAVNAGILPHWVQDVAKERDSK